MRASSSCIIVSKMSEFPLTPPAQDPQPDEKKEKVVPVKEIALPDKIRIRPPKKEEDEE